MKKSASELATGGELVAHMDGEEMVWLLGQPHLTDYLAFVREKVIGGEHMSQRLLADEWRKANDLYYELEQSEAGFADGAECLPLPKEMRGLARALKRDRYFTETFDTLPTEIRMVELAKLIVSQSNVSCEFSEALRKRLREARDPASLFRFCLPAERDLPPVTVRKSGKDRYVFTSPSTDFRLHNPAVLAAADVGGLKPFGPVASVFALPVGFGSNFLSVVASDDRLLLQNGYHRSYSLLAAGFTHAPAVVQLVTRKDELRIAATDDVNNDPAFYFRAARPPVLKDFLDPRFGRKLLAKRMQTTIEIEWKVRSSTGSLV
ncbi:MAG: hypothetical protein E6G94_09230 [Alphaproteobacteria bacterium]|nr:MAG: hypothetical protein E6G94_09230 [Alphaproteobacteria bacterium]